MKQNKIKNKTTEHDSATFVLYIYKDIKKLYIFVSKLLQTCNSLHKFNTAGIKRSRTDWPPTHWGGVGWGWDYANHPNPEAIHAGG